MTIPEQAALLPCPFCGSAEVSASIGKTGDDEPWRYIECESCAASAEPDVWNKRAAQPLMGVMRREDVARAAGAIKVRFAQSFPDQVSMLNPRLHVDLAEAALSAAHTRQRQEGAERAVEVEAYRRYPEVAGHVTNTRLVERAAFIAGARFARSAASPRAEGEWQNISTVPKDEDVLLGWQDWRGDWQWKVGLGQCTRGGWRDGQATHWMRLPAAPQPLLAEQREVKS